MTLLEEIKANQLTARKASKGVESRLLTTLIGEAQIIGKNDGNRDTTDLEVIAIIKKFVKNIDECLAVIGPQDVAYHVSLEEKQILTAYLPTQMDDQTLSLTVQNIIGEISASAKDMGKVMAILKQRHDGLYDGKAASLIVKNMLAS